MKKLTFWWKQFCFSVGAQINAVLLLMLILFLSFSIYNHSLFNPVSYTHLDVYKRQRMESVCVYRTVCRDRMACRDRKVRRDRMACCPRKAAGPGKIRCPGRIHCPG